MGCCHLSAVVTPSSKPQPQSWTPASPTVGVGWGEGCAEPPSTTERGRREESSKGLPDQTRAVPPVGWTSV